jgi:cytochrome c biogenesis protein CcdA
MRWLFAVLLVLAPGLVILAPGRAAAATSNVFTSREVSLALVSATNDPGDVRLALDFHLAPGWHIYWRYAGDAGFPPAVMLAAPAVAGPLSFPAPALLSQPPVTDYVVSGHAVLPFPVRQAGATVRAQVNWLVCADICIPQQAQLTLSLAGGASAQAGLFLAPAVVTSPFATTIAPDGTLHASGPGAGDVTEAHFFPDGAGQIVNGAPQTLSFDATGLSLHLTRPDHAVALSGVLELTDRSGAVAALGMVPRPITAPAHLPYWLLAFIGGLILNLMPCVFPVLALKAFSILKAGAARARFEALGYSAGVVVSMLALGAALLSLRAAGVAAGWGFQLQSPVAVAVIAWLIFAAALSLAGVAEFRTPAAFGRLPALGSFGTGILAVIVATPCTAPFMGVALAAALGAPAIDALVIFGALGLGLAAPALLLAAVPPLARLLPRPGAWMLWLQRLLALPMLATFAWLAWILQRQTGLHGLLLLLAGALILVITLRRATTQVYALLAFALLAFLHTAPVAALTLPGASPYSAARLATARAQRRPVFIDLTAAWCVSCLVNEATTLTAPAVQAAFKAHGVTLLVGDWTQKSPAISALLAQAHAAGVPLYLYYPPGAAAPAQLPQVLTPGLVLTALASAPAAPPPVAPTPARGG